MSEGDSVGNGNSNGNGAAAKVPQWTDEDDKALHEAARYLSTAHLSFIAISIYLALAIWQTTHQQLLLGAACTALLALLLDALVVLFSRMFLERGLTAKEA